MKILTRYYVALLLVAFVSLVFFVGLLKAALLSALITVAKYLFDKYLMTRMNPFIDKIIGWVTKSKVAIKEIKEEIKEEEKEKTTE